MTRTCPNLDRKVGARKISQGVLLKRLETRPQSHLNSDRTARIPQGTMYG